MAKFFRKKIQAFPEGSQETTTLESLLISNSSGAGIAGTVNAYKNYDSQVNETYRKYNGLSDFGVSQVRAVVDIRTAMVSGEGVSISTQDENLSKWIEKFLNNNKILNGSKLHNAIKGTEISGQSLLFLELKKDKAGEPEIIVKRLGYSATCQFRPVYKDPDFKEEISHVERKVKRGDSYVWESIKGNYIYVRTGGDDSQSFGATTKIGVVLTDCENYDRAIKDMRRNNHITARVTPVFKTEDEKQANTIKKALNESRWKIGKAYAGSADFKYVTPGTTAHENLKSEMVATLKNISGTTGVPVHWFGYTDLMSNRSTANSLYEMIKHQTSIERGLWEEAIFELIYKALELYIDNGGQGVKLTRDFQVRLPLLDFSEFYERVKALSLAYSDNAISLDDYRSALPGIDPMKTKKAVDLEMEDNLIEPLDLDSKIKYMDETEEKDNE